MMFQYVNLFDFWWSPHWGGGTSPPGGLLTNIDGMNVLQERKGVPDSGSLSGAGFWADAQQLEVCNFGKGNEFAPAGVPLGMTLEEYRSHYTIWAMYASPMVRAVYGAGAACVFEHVLFLIEDPGYSMLVWMGQEPQYENRQHPPQAGERIRRAPTAHTFPRWLVGGV